MLRVLRKRRRKLIGSVFDLITDYRLLTTMSALVLTSCMGVYEGGFECPPGEGVGCKSISEVNQLINEGQLPKHSTIPSQSACGHCHISSKDLPNIEDHELPIWFVPEGFVDNPLLEV